MYAGGLHSRLETKGRDVTVGRGRSLLLLGLPLLFAVVALALRSHRLDAQSVWLDEGLSIVFARPVLDSLLSILITRDIHPPLYIVLLHYWDGMAGESEFAVRYLSVVFGVLLVPLVYRLAVDLFATPGGERREAQVAGLIAAMLVAVSPFLVYYSQEARNYIVVTFWATLASFALWRGLGGRGRGWWVAYGLASALVIYTHYYGFFVLLAHAAYLLLTWSRNRSALRPWLAALAGAGVLYTPWLVGLIDQARRLWRSPDYWSGTIDLATIAARTFASFSVGNVQSGLLGQGLLVFGLLFGAGLFVLLVRGGLRSGSGELYLLFYTVVPLLAVYAISARNPKFAERYLIMISPAFYLVLGRGLAAVYGVGRRLAGRWPVAPALGAAACLAGACAVVGLSMAATWGVYYSPEWAKDDYRGAIRLIEEQSRPGDFILLVRNAYHPMEYYYEGDLPWGGFDPARADKAPDVEAVAARLNKMLHGHKRVWLLLWQDHVVDSTGTVAGLLRKFGKQVPVAATFTGVRVELYELAPDVVFGAEPERRLDVRYENGVAIVGFDLLTPQVRPGQTIDLGLYWQATGQLDEEIGVGISLVDDRGFIWASETHRPTGEYLASTRWPVDRPVRGECPLRLPPGTPPGRYALELNVHNAASLRELSRVMASGQPLGTRFLLAEIEVLPADAEQWPSAEDLGVAKALQADFAAAGRGSVRLLGHGGLPAELAQGSAYDLSLYWEMREPAAVDYEVAIEFAGEQTHTLARAPLAAGYATQAWRRGERLRGQYRLLVPPTVPAGDYSVRLRVLAAGSQGYLAAGSGETGVALGTVRVREPQRTMAPPAVGHEQGTRFGEVAALYGFDLRLPQAAEDGLRPGDNVDITLTWQSLAPTSTSYKVFVHLADASQRPWAQHDGPPAAGARPTTGWMAGEYVRDDRRLTIGSDVPPGRYRLLVGLYGPDGKRLPATDASGAPLGDAVPLAGVELEVGQ